LPENKEDERTPPEDPSGITLTYEHRHYWWFSADDAPETWHVSADLGDGGAHVGDLDITLVDTYETRDPVALLDGQDAELGHGAAAIFDAGGGRLDPDLDEQLEAGYGRPGCDRGDVAATDDNRLRGVH
jgi:hypothetical protein